MRTRSGYLKQWILPRWEEARDAVDSLLQRGVDFVKVYEMLQPDVFRTILQESKVRQIVVAGHVPLTVDAGEASDLGMRSFEHLRNIDLSCSSEADSLRAARTAQMAREAGYSGNADPLRGSWSLGYGSGEKVRADIMPPNDRALSTLRTLHAVPH